MRKSIRPPIASKKNSGSPIDLYSSMEGDGGGREDDVIKCLRVFTFLRRYLNKCKHGYTYDMKRLISPRQSENRDQSIFLASSSSNENKIFIPSYFRKRLELKEITIMAKKLVILKWIFLIKKRSVYVSEHQKNLLYKLKLFFDWKIFLFIRIQCINSIYMYDTDYVFMNNDLC